MARDRLGWSCSQTEIETTETLQGGAQQRKIVPVRRATAPQGPCAVGEQGAFGALFPSARRGTTSSSLTPAGRLDDTAVDQEVFQVRADHLVVAVTGGGFQTGEDPQPDPLITTGS